VSFAVYGFLNVLLGSFDSRQGAQMRMGMTRLGFGCRAEKPG